LLNFFSSSALSKTRGKQQVGRQLAITIFACLFSFSSPAYDMQGKQTTILQKAHHYHPPLFLLLTASWNAIKQTTSSQKKFHQHCCRSFFLLLHPAEEYKRSLQKLTIVTCSFFFPPLHLTQQEQTTSQYEACHLCCRLPLYLLLHPVQTRNKKKQQVSTARCRSPLFFLFSAFWNATTTKTLVQLAITVVAATTA